MTRFDEKLLSTSASFLFLQSIIARSTPVNTELKQLGTVNVTELVQVFKYLYQILSQPSLLQCDEDESLRWAAHGCPRNDGVFR